MTTEWRWSTINSKNYVIKLGKLMLEHNESKVATVNVT